MKSIPGARWRRTFRGGLLLLLGVVTAAVSPHRADAQTVCGFTTPGSALTGNINRYWAGINSPAAGSTSFQVNDSTDRGATPTTFAAGDMLLVIQMQDADIDSSNNANYGDGAGGAVGSGVTANNRTGLYEYVMVVSTSGAAATRTVNIVGAGTGNGLVNSYRNGAAVAGTNGQRRWQVVRVPQYGNATLSNATPVTSLAWNGLNGGVVVFDVSGTLNLGGTLAAPITINVNGQGFRGGAGRILDGDTTGVTDTDYRSLSTDEAHGQKGEGIAGTPRHVFDAAGLITDTGVEGYPNGTSARGAPGPAGGGGTDDDVDDNQENSGGGGGANGGAGGIGGNSWNTSAALGGKGGSAFSVTSSNRQILGGGGGAGTANNCGPGDGGPGGGIVIIRAGTVAGTGTFTARGTNGSNAGHDGAGGGGAGGRVVVVSDTANVLGGLSVDVRGGDGGWANITNPPGPNPSCTSGDEHGPGGGGGGGVVFTSSATAASNVAGGAHGWTNENAGDHDAGDTLDAFGSADGDPGFTATMAMADFPGVLPCTVATKASVCGVRVDPSGLVEFATSTQRGTLGFNLYASESADKTRLRVRLTDKPVLAPVPSSGTPILYRAETARVEGAFLWIEEIETSGRRRLLGPFAVGDDVLRVNYERVERWAATQENSDRGGARVTGSRRRPEGFARGWRREMRRVLRRARGATSGVKIEVAEAGPVKVPVSDLVAAGLPPGATRTLQLWNLGRPVPFRIITDETGAAALTFAAETLSTDYTGRNPYVVLWGVRRPLTPSVPFTRSGFPPVPGMHRVEQQVFHAPFVPRPGDPWIWDLLGSGMTGGPYVFDLPGLLAAPPVVPVRVGVVGGSDHSHTVQVTINGHPVGSATFSGKSLAVVTGTIPGAMLRASGNELALSYSAATSGPEDFGLLFFDSVDLGVTPAPPTDWVLAERVVPYEPSAPLGQGVEYLIVTHDDFREAALRIAALKEAEGLRAAVVDVDGVYDRYSGGAVEAAAIQALVRDGGRRLRYVLLVGDDSFDPKDLSQSGQVSYVPSLDAWDGQFGRVPSENLYADTDGDGRPDVAIGRLPVQTAEQAAVLVDKIERQSSVLAEAGERHLFGVDNQTPGDASFLREAERVSASLPAGAQTEWADVAQGVDEARAAFFAGLQSGPLATHYFGHGSLDFWADEGFLTASDAASLAPEGRETVLFAWTCESQNYQYGLGPSLSEALVLAPRAGALASVGPTGITDPLPQSALYMRVYRHFLDGVPLGESVRRAKVEALRHDPSSRAVVEGWSLLGDPALTIPRRD
jgi:hypothetical protein